MKLRKPELTCSNCGREVSDGGSFVESDEDGEIYFFCPDCWALEFDDERRIGVGRYRVKLSEASLST